MKTLSIKIGRIEVVLGRPMTVNNVAPHDLYLDGDGTHLRIGQTVPLNDFLYTVSKHSKRHAVLHLMQEGVKMKAVVREWQDEPE